MELTDEQQQFLESLDDITQREILKLDIAGQIKYLESKMLAETPTTTLPPETLTGAFVPIYTAGATSGSAEETFYYQPALGVTGGRRVSKNTGLAEPGTYTGFLPFLDSEERRRGVPQALPKYFQGDEDLINQFSREEIATIQSQMKTAGILGKYKLGIVDNATLNAFKTVLEQANRTGSEWTSGLQALQTGQTGGTGLTARVSSPDDLNRIIDASAKYILGRSIDPATSQRIGKAYQQLQIEEQRQNKMGGVQTQAPEARVFAEKQLKDQSGPEADAYRFAQYASSILGGQNG